MTPSSKCIALMHQFEGYAERLPDGRCRAYPDPGSKDGRPVTIGWGTTRDEQGRPIALGTIWTRERADARFAADLAVFAQGVAGILRAAPTTQNQFDALVALAYNIGTESLRTSTLMRMHRDGDYAGAAAQFGRWVRNDGKVMRGLVRRRAAERALYEGKA